MSRYLLFLLFLFLYAPSIYADKELSYSGTIPVVFIETNNGDSILSKEDYMSAKMYIEAYGNEGYEDVASRDQPLEILIRGRGNWTWRRFEKKPYKIKLEDAYGLLGMKKNKHWALLAHADDLTGFYRNTVGFEISRMVGMEYTPEQRPVELMLNGKYQGMYMLTETIRTGESRVNITAEDDYLEDYGSIGKGGWLVEFDNYEDDHQIKIDVSDVYLETFYITYHTPKELSERQKDYLFNQFTSIKEAIFSRDSASRVWENYIDIDALARYCLIAEITSHQEAFFGSCFLHKDAGEARWKFGPVWDFGNAISQYWRGFMWEDSNFGKSIMTELSKFDSFQNYIRNLWPDFYSKTYPYIDDYIDKFADNIREAVKNDAERWPQYGHSDITECADIVKNSMKSRIEWLNLQWKRDNDVSIQNVKKESHLTPMYTIDGIRQKSAPPRNRIVISQGSKYISR